MGLKVFFKYRLGLRLALPQELVLGLVGASFPDKASKLRSGCSRIVLWLRTALN